MSLRSGSALLIVAFVLLISASARAEMFTAYLTPAQEVPPTASTARGFARVLVNETTGQITFTVVFEGLSSTQTLAHIHAPAAIGASASPIIDFPVVGGTSGTITGTAAITPTQISQLRQHLGYVNVHSTNFPNGEIRGQLGAARPVDYDGDGRTDPSVLRFPNIDPPDVALGDAPHELLHCGPVGDERREVLEEHPRFREVGDVAQMAAHQLRDLRGRAVRRRGAHGHLLDFGARLGWLRGPAWAYLWTGRPGPPAAAAVPRSVGRRAPVGSSPTPFAPAQSAPTGTGTSAGASPEATPRAASRAACLAP